MSKQNGNRTIPLSRLPEGRQGRIVNVKAPPELSRRLLELGLTRGTVVRSRFRSMLGDPTAYEVRGVLLGLRESDARRIIVELLPE